MVADQEEETRIWSVSCVLISSWKKKSNGKMACLQKRPAMPRDAPSATRP